jgi:hypothetical protein
MPLLVIDPQIGTSRWRWLNTGPTEASAAAVKTEVTKLLFLRGLDAQTLDLSVLPAERRRFLAAVGRRSSVAKLSRRDPERRYPILLTLLAQSATDVLDEVVQLFDQALSARESRARHKLAGQLAERAKHSDDKLAIAEIVLPVLADPGIPDEQVGGLLRGEIGMERLRETMAQPPTTRLPRDHGQLEVLESSYGYLRQFTARVLEVIEFLAAQPPRNYSRRCGCCACSTRPARGGSRPRRRPGSCRPGGGATWTTRSPLGTQPPTGTTGS